MGLESGSFIPDLVDTNPAGTDPKSQGDDHLRLIKTCTQGSFPAFVGTQAVPAFVSLTEDEISDAALKSADNVLTGDNIFSGSLGITVSSIQPKQAFQDTDGAVDEKNYLYRGQGGNWGLFLATDAAPAAVGQNCWQVFRTGAVVDRMAFSVGNAVVAETALRNDGSLTVRSRTNVTMKAGFRNPSHVAFSGPWTLNQDHEGLSIVLAAGAEAGTIPQLQQYTQMALFQSIDGGQVVLDGSAASITFTAYDGSGTRVSGSIVTIEGAAVVQLYYRDVDQVYVYGNGFVVS